MSDFELINNAKASLVNIGFTALESDLYLFLQINGASTGYAVAKGIGKPVGNVYKALESLTLKGGASRSQSESITYVAVSWKNIISRQRNVFEQNIEQLQESLEKLPKKELDDHVYQVTNFQQIIEQANSAIKNSTHIILADLEPGSVIWFKNALEQAAKRGVEVRVKTYASEKIDGVRTTNRQKGEEIWASTQDISFHICADGIETAMAMIRSDKKTIIQAFHTKSVFLNMTVYYSLLYGLILTELKENIFDSDLVKAKKLLENTTHLHPFSAKNKIFQAFEKRYDSLR